MAEINPLDEAVAVVVVTVDEVRLAAGAVVAEIKAAVVAGTDTFAARMSVRVRRRIGTVVEVAGIFVAGVIAAVVFRDGGGLNTRVGTVLRTGGGRNTKVGAEVTVAGRGWRPGVLAGMFVDIGTTNVAVVAGTVGVEDLDLLKLPPLLLDPASLVALPAVALLP